MTRLRLGIAIIASVASMTFVTEADAQITGVRAGEDVRIHSATAVGRYTVVETNGGALTLRAADGALIHVPAGAITRLEWHRGPRSRGRGALRGLGIGFAAGAVGGALFGFADGDDSGGIINFSAEEKAAMAGVLFGVTAGVLGAGIGAALPGQLWERVPLADAASVGASPDGGLAVSYALRF